MNAIIYAAKSRKGSCEGSVRIVPALPAESMGRLLSEPPADGLSAILA